MEQPTEFLPLRDHYIALNRSFRRTLVYHMGIDTGFFTEYSSLVHAALFCAERHLQLKLYSDDANFRAERGWTDYFEPFCEEVHEPFHARLNHYSGLSWRQILVESPARQWARFTKWKLKLWARDLRGRQLARRAYGQPTWLSHHVGTHCFRPYCVPELGIEGAEGDYLSAFRRMATLLWRLNDPMRREVDALKSGVALESGYMGCQIRGGDKITESDFIPPAVYAERLRRLGARCVFVLTDDYALFEQLQQLEPSIRWRTLCQPSERGYVNGQFTRVQGEAKRAQMARFFASMELLLASARFVGSITPAPSHFLLKMKLPDAEPIDCPPDRAAEAVMHRIGYRAALAHQYLQEKSKSRENEKSKSREIPPKKNPEFPMKYAVVTGGTKGIGAAIVKTLLRRGYFVLTNYAHDTEGAERAEKDFDTISPHFLIMQADQAEPREMAEFVQLVKEHAPKVHCIVCNAGMTVRRPAMQLSNEEWETVMQVTVNSHFFLIRDLYDRIPHDSRIVFIGSMMGVLPHGTSLPYGVTKSAVHALARNLVKEFEGTGTTVNAIAPGFVETEWQKNKPEAIRQNICRKTALQRFASVDEIASAVAFCLDNAFVNGTVLEVSGGYCYK